MPDSIVRAQLTVAGGPAALAELSAFRAAIADIGKAQAATSLKVDTSALTTAKSDVAALSTAHQALAAKPVALGIDVAQIESARGSVKNLDNDLLSLATTASKVGPAFALGVAAGGLTKFASDYQTLMQQTVNQTNLGSDAVATLDKTIRALPSGNAPFADLATGLKNITDLGYSAADAQKIANEESKAATETGANQATTMLAITSAMKEYNAQASEVARYTNIVAEAAKLGNTSLQAWTEGTRTGVAVAAAYGVSLEEADAFMVALTRHGFDAAESATQLRGVIQHIVNPNQAAQQVIADVSKQTGIDLTGDFSDQGLKARGFANIMQDLQDVIAKTGDESIITKLIPALRGGQGALITVTQAAADAKLSLADLGQAADGSLTPVEDGFAAIQQTAGYQFGQTLKELKFDLIDIGQAGLPPVTALAHVFGEIPAPVIKFGVELGLAAAAVKTASVAGDLLTAGLAKAGTAIAGDAVVTAADTAAVTANTTALAANATARGAVSAAALKNPLLAGEELAPSVLAGSSAAKTQIALDTEIAVREVGTASAAATIGAAVAGIGKTLGRLIVPVSIGLIAYEVVGKPVEDAIRQKVSELERPQADLSTLNTDDEASFEAGIKARLDKQQQIVDQYNSYKDSAGYKIAKVENLGGELQSDRDYKNAIQNIKDIQQAELDYQQVHHNTTELGPPLPANYSDPNTQITIQNEKDIADAEKASNQARIDDAKSVAEMQKQQVQSVADAQVAAATKSADAWKAANAAIGKIDLSKGLASLGDLGAGIDKVQSDLAALGESDVHLNALAGIIDQFTALTDAEKAASVAYESYMGLLSESDVRIQKLQALKKSYDDAADAALRAQRAGSATPAQNDLVSGRTAVDANIDAQITHIQRNQAGDLVAAVKVAPDSAGFDDQLRAQIQAQGGPPAVAATVTAETKQAEADLTAFENKDRQAIVKIQADTKDATAAIDAFIAHIPTTIPVLLTTQPGQPDPTRGYGGDGGASGVSMPGMQSAQSGGAGGFGAGGGGTIRYSDYQKVVSQYPGSPLNNQASFNDLTSVAGQTGVDPRILMAIMQTESEYGTTAGKIGQQYNYGGMGVNDRGYGHDSGVHATDGGPEYAGYNDFKSFLMDIAAWVKQNGSSFRNYQTQDQGQGKTGTIAQLQAQVPLVGAGYGTGGVVTGSEGGGVALDSTASTVGQQIVAKALQSVNTDHLANYCEQFVEETVQSITGQRGATGRREVSASSAFADAQSLGLVTKTPEPGDLVYYGGTPGNPDGHVAIYMGGGKQVSTADHNEQGANAVVHTEDVGPGAQYVSVGGVRNLSEHQQSGAYSNIAGMPGGPPQAVSSTGGTTNLSDPNSPAAQEALAQKTRDANDYALSMQNIATAGEKVAASFAHVNPAGMQAAIAEFQKMQPLFEKQQLASLGPDATESDKQIASNKAWGQALEYEAAYAKLLGDIENHTGTVADDTEKVAQIVGGPMAEAYAQAAAASAQIAAASAETTRLTTEQNAVVQARQAADQAAQRAQTEQQWAQQAADTARARAETAYQQQVADTRTAVQRGEEDAAFQRQQDATARQNAHDQEMRNIQDETQAENDSYTVISRNQEDKTRYLQFYGSEQKRLLTDQAFDASQAFFKNRNSENADSQLLTADTKGAGTNAAAEAFAAQNAALKDRMATEDDANTKAIADNKNLQMLEDRKSAQEQYDLETETIAQQRAHEDTLAALAKQQTASDRAFQDAQTQIAAQDVAIQRSQVLEQRGWADLDKAHQRSFDAQSNQIADTRAAEDHAHQEELWQIADARAAEDKSYQAALDAQKAITASAQASLDAANQSLTVWEQTGQVIATAAQGAAAAAQSQPSYIDSTAALTGPNAIHTLGGHATGGVIPLTEPYSLVGDAPGGAVTPYSEIVTAPGYTVTPIRDLSAQNGGTAHPTISPTYNITIVQQPGEDAAALWARLKPMLDQYERETSIATRHAAMGGAR